MRIAGLAAGLALATLAGSTTVTGHHDQEPRQPKRDPKPEKPKAYRPDKCEIVVADDDIPRQLSVRYNSPHFHGGVSKMIGLIVDGQPRNDCRDYDLDKQQIRGKGDWEFPSKIEVFWLEQPSRQVRRSLRRGR